MKKIKAIIFDLDNTLVSTKNLKAFRDNRAFDQIQQNDIEKTALYSPVREMLEKIKSKRVRMGILTNSPRRYAERLLKHHKIERFFEVVVTYDDVGATGKKPSPLGLIRAMDKLGISRSAGVAYVGDERIDVEAAYRAGVIPIVPSWGSRSPVEIPPAAELSSQFLIDVCDDQDELLPMAERCAQHASTEFPRNLARFIPLNENAEVVTLKKAMRIFCLGRYFSQSSACTSGLHDNHPLSLEIARKDQDQNYKPPGWIGEMLAKLIVKAGPFVFGEGIDFDLVTIIPRKPTKPPRLELVLSQIKGNLEDSHSHMQFVPDIFHFDQGASRSIKGLNPSQRRTEQFEHLHAGPFSIGGKRVLILDDVITTGATISRAISLLEQQGAKAVVAVALAKTVSLPEDKRVCPECGRYMFIRKSASTGRFWSCSGYNEQQACNYTEDVDVQECPKCGSKLRVRKNSNDGSLFRGCTSYPACKYTRSLK